MPQHLKPWQKVWDIPDEEEPDAIPQPVVDEPVAIAPPPPVTRAPESIPVPERAGFIKRVSANFLASLTKIAPIEEKLFTTPALLVPEELKAVPNRQLFEQAFGLRRRREDVFVPPKTIKEARKQVAGLPFREKKTAKELEQIAQDLFKTPRLKPLEADITAAFRGLEELDVSRLRQLGIEPPETWQERVADAAGGLAAIVTRFSIIHKVGKLPLSKLPKLLQTAALFEVESQLAGQPTGEGAAMGLGLTGIGLLPARVGFKLGLETVSFGALSSMAGGDEVDIMIAMAIPGALRGKDAVRRAFIKQIRGAKTIDEVVKIMVKATEVGKKAMVEQKVPEPTWEDVVRGVGKLEAKMDVAERKLRADKIREFRKVMNPEPPTAEAIVVRKEPKVIKPVVPAAEQAIKEVVEERPVETPSKKLGEALEGIVSEAIEKGIRAAERPAETPLSSIEKKVLNALPTAGKGGATQRSLEKPTRLRRDEVNFAVVGLERRGLIKFEKGRLHKLPEISKFEKSRPAPAEQLVEEVVSPVEKKVLNALSAFLKGEAPLVAVGVPSEPFGRALKGLIKAGFVSLPGRGPPKITSLGREALRIAPEISKKAPQISEATAKRARTTKPLETQTPKSPEAPERIKLLPSRPRRLTLDRFRSLLEEGRIRPTDKAKSLDPADQYQYHFDRGGIVLPQIKKAKVASVAGIQSKAQSEGIDRKFEFIAPDPQVATERLALLDALNSGLEGLTPQERSIIQNSHGLGNRKPRSYEEIAEELGITPEGVRQIEDQAIIKLRGDVEKTFGGQALKRSGIPGARAGGVPIHPFTAMLQFLGRPFRIMNTIIQFEARDMLDNVGRNGGTFGRTVENSLRTIVDNQAGYLGAFQKSQNIGQKIIRAHPKAAWDLQDRVYRDRVTTWTVDPIVEMVRGTRKPRNKSEQAIVDVLRKAALETGELLEQKNFQITLRKGKKIVRIPFKKAKDGKVFLSLSTAEFYDILFRGEGRADRMYETVINAYAGANGMTTKDVRRIFDKEIRPSVAGNDPRSGFRQIGPELARHFDVRPTGVRARNGKHVQILVTEPRAYLDSLYTSTAIRAGFVEAFGQDGLVIRRLRTAYLLHGGTQGAFDAVIRSMSDIPPFAFLGREPIVTPLDPSSGDYAVARFFNSFMEVYKQALLSSTAPIQLSEPIGFGGILGYRNLVKGMIRVFPFAPSRQIVMDDLVSTRAFTKDIISTSLNRSRPYSDFMNKMASFMSRAHLNQVANEFANELPAAAQGGVWLESVMERVRLGKEPLTSDIFRFRILDFSNADALRLAQGKGSSAEYQAAWRRATRLAVGTTALASQRSPLRNTRAYKFLVPFTGFFSNRVRTFDLFRKEWVRSVRNIQKEPEQAWQATFQFAKFLVGVEAAGVVASYLWSYIREGPIGFQIKNRQFLDDPKDFIVEAFVYGSFGPVYGAFAAVIGGLRSQEPTEKLLRSLMRIILPLGVSIDFVDYLRGTGSYQDRSWMEKTEKVFSKHLPILKTIPGIVIADILGAQVQDPKYTAAVRAYWQWRLDPDHESLPPVIESLGSMTDAHEEYRRFLRRALKAQSAGDNPYPDLLRAFRADPGDLAAAIRAKKRLDIPQLNDAKRRALAGSMGPVAYRALLRHDALLDLLAFRVKEISALGSKLKQRKSRIENIEQEARRIGPRSSAGTHHRTGPTTASQRARGTQSVPVRVARRVDPRRPHSVLSEALFGSSEIL